MPLQIDTERLFLRPLAPADYEPHAAMMAHPDVARFLTVEKAPQSRNAEWRRFAMLLGHWQMRGFGLFSVFEQAGGAWVGRVGPLEPEGWPTIECGWAIDRAYWGKGYASEAAIGAIAWIFRERPALPRVISLIDAANLNSQRVAAKVGEIHTGEIYRHDPAGDLDVWSANRDDWLRRFG